MTTVEVQALVADREGTAAMPYPIQGYCLCWRCRSSDVASIYL